MTGSKHFNRLQLCEENVFLKARTHAIPETFDRTAMEDKGAASCFRLILLALKYEILSPQLAQNLFCYRYHLPYY